MWISVWADRLHRADTFQSNRPQTHTVSPYNELQWRLQTTRANPQFKGCHVPFRVDEAIRGARSHTTHSELWTGSSCRRHPQQYIARWNKVYTNTWLRHPVAVGADSLHANPVSVHVQCPHLVRTNRFLQTVCWSKVVDLPCPTAASFIRATYIASGAALCTFIQVKNQDSR